MKQVLFCFVIICSACNNNDQQDQSSADTVKTRIDTTVSKVRMEEVKSETPPPPPLPPTAPKIYANTRFKDVTVKKIGEHQFLIKGKAQVFEANISWVVEDGHNELKKGFVMTDAGAPEWGNFTFSIDVTKKRENSTLTLILFESSAKDGSRQHELPIVLY